MVMLGSVRINSPMEGSYMNPLTPFPKDSTIMVAEPYRAYPAATRLLPGCRASATTGSPGDVFLQGNTITN